MSNGMRVDLSALDEVIRKLNGLLSDMDSAHTKAKYETDIPSTAFGSMKFLESNELHTYHEQMKTKIENVISGLHSLIHDFGTSTAKVRDKYHNQEQANQQGVSAASGSKSNGSAY
jgi:tetrahydromethanopterin S-methyltransferase subunit E